MKKKNVFLIVILLLIGLTGILFFRGTYVRVDGKWLRRDTTELDYSGKEPPAPEELQVLSELKVLDLRNTGICVETYEAFRTYLPDCEIKWQVPFQGGFLEPDIKELTISSIAEEDIQILGYFPDLESIDAGDCSDLDALMELQAQYPACSVRYQVPVGEMRVSGDSVSLEIADGDAAELMNCLRYLPQLENVVFTGTMPENEAVYALKQAYPNVNFQWRFFLFGIETDSNARELDLSGISMESTEEVESYLKYFNGLEKVIMCDCGISSEEMDQLGKRWPDIRFVWNIMVGIYKVRTDVTTLMPFQLGYDGLTSEKKLRNLHCTELKYLVDLVCIDFGHMEVRDLSFVQYMPDLEYLLLCGNGIKDITPLAGLQKLKYLELFANSVTDISALSQCPALEDVNLCYNTITDITPLLELENLNNIWISGWNLDEEQIALLQQAHPDANIVLDAYRSTGRGWRDLPNYFAQRDLLGMWYMVTND